MPDVPRAPSRLSSTGNSQHVLIPKPLLSQLPWKVGEDLMVTVEPDGSARITTLEQYFRDRLAAELTQRGVSPSTVSA